MSHNQMNLPTTSHHQARLQMYQATVKPRQMRRVIETPWGSATIEGCLGQPHASLIEAILYRAKRGGIDDQGRLHLVVDPYILRCTLGAGSCGSHEMLIKRAKEIMSAVVDVKVPARGVMILGSIIDEINSVDDASLKNRLAGILPDRRRVLWEVIFSRTYVEFLAGDISRRADPSPVVQLTHGVSQALARLVLTHSAEPSGGWKLDGLIEATGAGGRLRKRRDELRHDSLGLERLGIVIEGDRVRRRWAPSGPAEGAKK